MEVQNNTTAIAFEAKASSQVSRGPKEVSGQFSLDADVFIKSEDGFKAKMSLDYDVKFSAVLPRHPELKNTYDDKPKGISEKLEAEDNKVKEVETKEETQNPLEVKLDEIQAAIRKELLDSILESVDPHTKAALKAQFGDEHVLFEVEPDTKAAEVPEYWNAENTSQRIVDFAMSFAEGSDDPEFVESLRNAVMEGFAQAKEMLGDIPGESAQLFNDTYESAMMKFDEILGKFENIQDNISEQIANFTQQEAAGQSYLQTPTPSAPSQQLELVA